jgi:hypothetical protein
MDRAEQDELRAWQPPFPYGYTAAVDSAGTIAAPLLAGFSFTLIGLVVPKAEGIRWPGIALSLLIFAAVAFIAAVQYAFSARMWVTRPSEIAEQEPLTQPWEKVRIQRLHDLGFLRWFKRFQRAYRLGILSLFAGVGFLLIPAGPTERIPAERWAAISIAGAGFASELLWIFSNWILKGSPVAAIDGRPPDQPPPATAPIKELQPARWLARRFVPLIELNTGPAAQEGNVSETDPG